MKYNANSYPYRSMRAVTYGRRGMVATSHQLAAQAGLDILKQGGNAIDAAIATAACLTVVEPTSNGIGGDCFALVWHNDKLHGLNASGPSPKSISIDAVKEMGHDTMPSFGFTPVTVPGTPKGWADLNQRFGSLTLEQILKPAIEYAKNGHPVSPMVSSAWVRASQVYKKHLPANQYKSWADTFTINGQAPEVGQVWASPAHADTLQRIADTNARDFYEGEIAGKIDAYSKECGGFITKDDLTGYKAEWVEPISVNYRGYKVWEIPPNGQGLVALMALNILKEFDFKSKNTTDTYHKQIEAIKLAFTDGKEYITDSKKMQISVNDLLSQNYAEIRKNLIVETAITPSPGKPPKGGTVYLATADDKGNMVSFIQSNYMGFGSGIVVPGTGVSLQNRGHSFSLDENHHNCLEPGKRTYHTIIPGFISKDNNPIGPFGVMGGFMQPQGHVQVIMNLIDFNLNPQSALDAPRWQWMEDKKVLVEHDLPLHIVRELIARGHEITYNSGYSTFGHGQIIIRDKNGVLIGGTEPRTNGAVVAW